MALPLFVFETSIFISNQKVAATADSPNLFVAATAI